MKVFVFGKTVDQKHKSGYNDDLVMPFGIAMFLRDTSLKFQQQAHDMTRATLGNMGKTNRILALIIQTKYKIHISVKTDHGHGRY
jgi:hypothetical protein